MNSIKNDSPKFSCLVCRSNNLFPVIGFENLPRITSDCRPFNSGGRLAVCEECSLVQKIPDTQWLDEINTVYKDYAAYSIGAGEEQLVMDPNTGFPRKRSEVLLNQIRNLEILPEKINVLDVGCGHGVSLMAMSDRFPKWDLYGHELDDSKLVKLEKINGFKKLFTDNLDSIDKNFGFISMIHSLEHFVEPFKVMCSLRQLLESDGIFFIEVCNVEENPFDILVVDHLTHFSPQSLSYAISQAGFDVKLLEKSWVKKEISMLAKRVSHDSKILKPINGAEVIKTITANVQWLEDLIIRARETAHHSLNFGIFGTSIAGTWLASALGDAVNFFVDEDVNRVGEKLLGKPIYRPEEIPTDATVFIALAPLLAKAIQHRLSLLDTNNNFIF